MNLNVASSTFNLSTRSFSGFSAGPQGKFNNTSRTDIIFFNVNLRRIVGDVIWDKYDYFNITCVNMQNSSIISYNPPTDANSRAGLCLMNGLEWVGNSNQTNSTSLNGYATIAVGVLGDVQLFNGFNQFTNTFKKGKSNVDINIKYVKGTDLTPLNLATAGNNTYQSNIGTGAYFPHQVYQFCIVPIDKKHISYNQEKQ
jgi:hypothetical protein